MAVFSLIAGNMTPKTAIRHLYHYTAEMGGFSMIGGTMPRMSKKRKLGCPSSSMTGGVWPTTTCAGSVSMVQTELPGCRDFPIVELAAGLVRSTITVKRSLKELLEDAGLILRVRRGGGKPNPHLHAAPPKKEGCRDE